MDRAEKETVVGDGQGASSTRMTSAVFLDFKGLNVESVTKLRDEFRKAASSTASSRTRWSSRRSSDHAWAKSLDTTPRRA